MALACETGNAFVRIYWNRIAVLDVRLGLDCAAFFCKIRLFLRSPTFPSFVSGFAATFSHGFC